MKKLIQESVDARLSVVIELILVNFFFMENRSCQGNLISFFDEIISLVDERNGTDIIDFCMAFDHEIILTKSAMQYHKVNLEWIKAGYLTISNVSCQQGIIIE